MNIMSTQQHSAEALTFLIFIHSGTMSTQMSIWNCWTQGSILAAENILRWCKLNRRNLVTRHHCKGSLSDNDVFIEDCIVIVLWCALWASRAFHWDGGIKPLGTYDEMTKRTTSLQYRLPSSTSFMVGGKMAAAGSGTRGSLGGGGNWTGCSYSSWAIAARSCGYLDSTMVSTCNAARVLQLPICLVQSHMINAIPGLDSYIMPLDSDINFAMYNLNIYARPYRI